MFQNHLLNGEPQALVDMLGLLGEGSDLDDDDMPSVSCGRVRAVRCHGTGLASACFGRRVIPGDRCLSALRNHQSAQESRGAGPSSPRTDSDASRCCCASVTSTRPCRISETLMKTTVKTTTTTILQSKWTRTTTAMTSTDKR